MQELDNLVLAGPDLARDGVVRWRCVDLRGQIKARFEVEVHERTVGKLLRRLDMTRLQPRPCHPKRDVAAQEAYKTVWAPIRSRPAQVRDCRHESAYLFGAVCPDRAVGAAIVMPWVSSEAMAIHLAEISKQVSAGAHALPVCDGAGWHQPGVRLVAPTTSPCCACRRVRLS